MRAYVAAALRHPLSLVIAGTGAMLAAAGWSETPLLVFGGFELIWVTAAVRSHRFRRAVDAKRERKRVLAWEQKNERLLSELAHDQRDYFLGLQGIGSRILHNWRRFESTGGSRLHEQMRARIEALLGSFLKLLVTLNDHRRYLSSTDRARIERELSELEGELPGSSEAVREVKKRRVEILRKRVARFRGAEESREVIRHQLASIEDLLRLVHEQSITLRDPAAMNRHLDTLALEVEEAENTARELERFLELDEEVKLLTRPERVGA